MHLAVAPGSVGRARRFDPVGQVLIIPMLSNVDHPEPDLGDEHFIHIEDVEASHTQFGM